MAATGTNDKLSKTDRSKLKRLRKRGDYDRATVNGLIDEAMMCHVAYVIEGEPYCTPTFVWRQGDHVYWHGSSISRFLQSVRGARACLTVTHFDALVLARSAFHHSANYRSVMLFGNVELVEGDAKSAALEAFVEGAFPGRWQSLRPMTRKELNATTVLRMPIDEGSAKMRSGPPEDDKADYELPIWAGEIPLSVAVGEPIADALNLADVKPPAHVTEFVIGQAKPD